MGLMSEQFLYSGKMDTNHHKVGRKSVPAISVVCLIEANNPAFQIDMLAPFQGNDLALQQAQEAGEW